MAYDQNLTARVRTCLGSLPGLTEKKMFGGVGFMLNGNMACGVNGNDLIVRTSPEKYAADLEEPHTRPFNMTGKPMSGWLMVEPDALGTQEALERWVNEGVEYARGLKGK